MGFLTSALSSWMLSPWLFLVGALAVSVPIIIHLLNKRRFKIVDWAAMDFLLEADKKNRRRVRLENLLLLAMRCLAVFLIGMLLARPFIPTTFASRLIDNAQFERVIVLDDSLSTQVQIGGESAMTHAKRSVANLLRSFASSTTEDSFTLLLTSQPDTPLVNAVRVTDETVDELVDRVESLEPSDRIAELNDAFLELEDIIAGDEGRSVNRVVYVVTDMRQHDWEPKEEEGENHPALVLARLSKLSAGCYVIDTGDDETGNLVVASIRPEDTLVAGRSSRFDVTVANRGARDAREVQVRFIAGDSIPLVEEIDLIPAGQSKTVPFSFTFVPTITEEGDDAQSSEVRVEVVSSQADEVDRLSADSTAYFAARVVRGIPTLLVDGDPSAAFGRSETFYLRRALAPVGEELSGIAADVVTETELESTPLDKYQVIFLCNVYRLSQQQIASLEQWVAGGGGLVMMLGDQVDEDFFNQSLFDEGRGLSPVRLIGPRGDETREQWVGFQVEDARHEMLEGFAGQNNPILERVQIFRWWETAPVETSGDSLVSIPARFTGEAHLPAMIEKGYDKGRVLVVTMPADADWSTWSDDPSYLIAMQELAGYMAGNKAGRGELRVGEPIRQPLDLTRYRIDAAIDMPGDRRTSVKASPEDKRSGAGPVADKPERDDAQAGDADGAKAEAASAAGGAAPAEESTVWQVQYDGTDQRGFYRLQLTRTDGGVERLLFAANVDPREGDLRRVDRAKLDAQIGDAPIKIIRGEEAAAQQAVGAQWEIWKYLLMGLVGVLLGEQVLGFLFGKRR
ncbi:MAG: BatA domain-containing protein [Pirellulaceae bacterium]